MQCRAPTTRVTNQEDRSNFGGGRGVWPLSLKLLLQFIDPEMLNKIESVKNNNRFMAVATLITTPLRSNRRHQSEVRRNGWVLGPMTVGCFDLQLEASCCSAVVSAYLFDHDHVLIDEVGTVSSSLSCLRKDRIDIKLYS